MENFNILLKKKMEVFWYVMIIVLKKIEKEEIKIVSME